MNSLDKLNFDNTFSNLPGCFYTRLNATALSNPELVCFSESAAQLLDLKDSPKTREKLTQTCSGNKILTGSSPLAMVYSGHQFGAYNPQLGDGRGLLLGEVINHHKEKWDLHLKGSGQTPYSRFGDGRAVLRSCIREYLGSEALYHLGIPTTRALCVITSDTPVYREKTEKGSTLLRLAKSHIRFGHFEYFYYTKQHEALKILADYTIEQCFPDLMHEPDSYLLFFQKVVTRTAELIAQWQAVGFAHGVMNSDNMSIIGDTFDYGPFGFMDDFNWHYICNHSDSQGRYAFSQQPDIGYWNCGRLAQALIPLVDNIEDLQTIINEYPQIYIKAYERLMAQKLGLHTKEDNDTNLIKDLLQLMHNSHCDYTHFFRSLSHFKPEQDSSGQGFSEKNNPYLQTLADDCHLNPWLNNYSARLKRDAIDNHQRSIRMQQVNPKFILRNYLAQIAIDKAEEGDYSEIEKLMKVLQSPFSEHRDSEELAKVPPEWGKKLEISCSS